MHLFAMPMVAKSVVLHPLQLTLNVQLYSYHEFNMLKKYEPPRGKTNNVVSEQVGHKSRCTITEDSLRLEILDLESRRIVLSV